MFIYLNIIIGGSRQPDHKIIYPSKIVYYNNNYYRQSHSNMVDGDNACACTS